MQHFDGLSVSSELSGNAAGESTHRSVNAAFFVLGAESCFVTIRNRRTRLQQGQVLFLEPRQPHVFSSVEDADFLLIEYTPQYAGTLALAINRFRLAAYFRQHRILSLPDSVFCQLWNTLQSLAFFKQAASDSSFRLSLIDHYFSAFLYILALETQEVSELALENSNRSRQIVFQFLKDVESYFLQNRSLSFYAERQSMSTRHLSTTVKSVTDKSAKQIIDSFLAQEAKQRVLAGKDTFNMIACDLGFSDQYSFSHFFKKHFGLSPRRYCDTYRMG